MKIFKVLAKSLNTNSFGLFRMVLVAEDGEAFEAHANSLNSREEGCVMPRRDNGLFYGCEMVNKLEDVPQEVIDLLFKRK